MARVIVWAKRDNDHEDPVIDAQKYKPGMVVTILEDGQEAGKEVEQSHWWRIIEVPGVPAAKLSYLCGCDPEFHDELTFASESKFPRKRVQRLNLDEIEKGLELKPEDSIVLTEKQLTDQAAIQPKADNPFVFADDANEFK